MEVKCDLNFFIYLFILNLNHVLIKNTVVVVTIWWDLVFLCSFDKLTTNTASLPFRSFQEQKNKSRIVFGSAVRS